MDYRWKKIVIFPHFMAPTEDINDESLPLEDVCSERMYSDVALSLRMVSVRDLGQADCQGWLSKKERGRGILARRWKKYWCVLKRMCLYWYTSQTAEKAVGYINLQDFTVEQTKECKKKYVLKVCHMQDLTLLFAADCMQDINKWLRAVARAAVQYSDTASEECYSEASDVEEADTEDTCPQNAEQLDKPAPPPRGASPRGASPRGASPHGASPPCWTMIPMVSPVCNTSSDSLLSESWAELSLELNQHLSEVSDSADRSNDEEDEDEDEDEDEEQQIGLQGHCSTERPVCDEIEMLYLHLKQANLSPTGALHPSTKQDLHSSFIRCCKDERVNDKLHLVRTLNSTLKDKEADLSAIKQVLGEPALNPFEYRAWREGNLLLLKEITYQHGPAEQNSEQLLEASLGPPPGQRPSTPSPSNTEAVGWDRCYHAR